MIIRKLFYFDNANFVRTAQNSFTPSLQAGSFKTEILLASDFFDNGQMIIDFGMMKHYFSDIIQLFNHSTIFCSDDQNENIELIKHYNPRWIAIPFNPSIEQFARIIFFFVHHFLPLIPYENGEKEIRLHSVIVHEGEATSVECYEEDLLNTNLGIIEPSKIILSSELQQELKFPHIWTQILQL